MRSFSARSLLYSSVLVTVTAFAADAQTVSPIGRAVTAVPSWYIGLAASVNYVRDAEIKQAGGAAAGNGTVEFGDGYGLTGAIGYRPRNTNSAWDYIRVETELAVRDNDLDRFVSNAGTTAVLTDDIQVETAMMNLFVDLPVDANWRPYIGGGIGGARVQFNSTALGVDDEDTVFAYQGMIGVYYRPPSLSVTEFGVGYRYLGLSNPKFASTTGAIRELEYKSHSLELGSRFYF